MDWDFLAVKIAPIVQAAASLIGVIGVFFVWQQIRAARSQLDATREQIRLNVDQISLTVEQMREQTKWHQINTQHTLLSVLPSKDAEQKFWEVVAKYRNEPTWQIADENCAKIFDDLDSWLTIKTFANSFERLCAAIEANSLDDDYAYSVHGAKVIDIFNTCEHYINFIRRKRNNLTIYIELEKVSTRWEKRAMEEQTSIEEDLAKLQKSRGAQKKIG